MSLTTDQITAKNFKDFYDQIRPYLNGAAHAGFTPVGTVISVMGNAAPQNYLACDGTAYNIADYPELAAYFVEQFESVNYFGGDGTITFAVPDLRGEFLRGTGTNSHENQGSGGEVGEHQDGTEFPFISSGTNIHVGKLTDGVLNGDGSGSTTGTNYVSPSGTTQWGTGFTSRPTNTSVLYCIAYKNIFNDAAEGQADVMPIASAGYKDRIVQYVGDTTVNFTNGFFYKCVEDSSTSPSTYSWEAVDTQSEMESLTASELQEIKDAFTPNTGAPLRMMNYSTDEQVIGKWIDGKTLYQKTVNFGALPNATQKRVAHSVTNINAIVAIEGYAKKQTGSMLWLPHVYYDNSKLFAITLDADTTDIIVSSFFDVSVYNECYFTLQYTKTTD